MTTKQLADRVTVSGVASNYRVVIEYRDKIYSCRSNNTLAMDRLHQQSTLRDSQRGTWGYTLRQALQAFYDECKSYNNL